MALVASGSVSDFTPAHRLALETTLASELGVAPAAVTLTLSAASVRLVFTVALESAARASEASAALSARLETTESATAFLSTSERPFVVVAVEAPRTAAAEPPTPPWLPPPPPPSAPNASGLLGNATAALSAGSAEGGSEDASPRAGAVLGAMSGCAALVVLVVGLGTLLLCRVRKARRRRLTASLRTRPAARPITRCRVTDDLTERAPAAHVAPKGLVQLAVQLGEPSCSMGSSEEPTAMVAAASPPLRLGAPESSPLTRL